MQVTITIPDAKKDVIIEALCSLGNYQEMIDHYNEGTGEATQIPNSETKPQFAKKQMISIVKQAVKEQIQREDSETFHMALQTKKRAIDSIGMS